MLIECLRETAIFFGIVIGIPCLLFGAFRFWQVFLRPVKPFRKIKRRR